MSAELAAALEQEIAAVKQRGGSQKAGLQDGARLGLRGDRHLYSFQLASELAVLDDTPAQLVVGEQTHEASVVTVDGFSIVVAVRIDIGEQIPSAHLTLASYFLFEILKDRIKEAADGRLSSNQPMALRVFGRLANVPISARREPDFGGSPAPNPAQQRAVRAALTQRVTFIWGPPGTGKTTTIRHLVPRLLERGERVLIASHTHVAVDAVLKAAIEGQYGKHPTDEHARLGEILRIGDPRDPDPNLGRFRLDHVVHLRSEELLKQRAALEAEIAAAEQAVGPLRAWQRHFVLVDELAALELRLTSLERELADTQLQLVATQGQVRQLEADLLQAEAAGILRRVWLGLHPDRIRPQLAERTQATATLTDAVADLTQDISRLSEVLGERRLDVKSTEERLLQQAERPSPEQVQAALSEADLRLRELRTKVSAVLEQLQNVESEVIDKAKVVGVTLAKLLVTPALQRAPFATVILDEASMVTQPYIWFVAGLAAERCVILGDFRQLPPIVAAEDVSRYPMAAKRLTRDIFREAKLVDDADLVQHMDPRLVCLTEQYRMHAQIGTIANLLIYDADGNPLVHRTAESELRQGLDAAPEPGRPLVLCDTSGVNPWCARAPAGYSRYNTYSAVVTARLAEQVLASAPGASVGVVTPYAVQARLIQSLLAGHKDPARILVATVHRFQGNQRDVMIIDLVDGPGQNPSKMTGDRRLLNVAFTRAKGKVILVSNAGYFADTCRADHPLASVHQYLTGEGRAAILDSRNLLTADDAAVLLAGERAAGATPLVDPGRFALFTENGFHRQFRADLLTATNRVMIYSPFVRGNRTGKLAPDFQALIARGVTIHVLTRRPGEHGRQEPEQEQVLAGLQKVGVEIAYREELHEKWAFIDHRIAWFGSLNILSHSRSTEQMMRFASEETVARLMDLSGAESALQAEQMRKHKSEQLAQFEATLKKWMKRPACPMCGQETRLEGGAEGPAYVCTNRRCPGRHEIPRATLTAVLDAMNLACPACGSGKMKARWSAKGPFLGCDKYPECRRILPFPGER